MHCFARTRIAGFCVLILFIQAVALAQGPGIVPPPGAPVSSTRVIQFSGGLDGQPDGPVSVTFALYPDQQSTSSLWTEVQTVQVTGGKFTALLGSSSATGIPPDFFIEDAARWLGVLVNGVEQRYLLVSVPYAMKAVAADSLGGVPAAQYVTTRQLQDALANLPAASGSSANTPGSLVQRDGTGSFAAGQIFADNFIGNGIGLVNIPNSATSATSANIPGAIITRDSLGGFAAGPIFGSFIGSGFGLFNIPPSAVGANVGNVPNAIVARDTFGGFAAGNIAATGFFGDGSGLTNIRNASTTATSANTSNAIVARDNNGNFAAGIVQANGLSASNFLTSSGAVDFSAATYSAPVKAVLSAQTPVTCVASRELLIKTDAPAGQQLFICNATSDGYVLVGDGSNNGITSVASGDSSVVIGGTGAVPTVAVANGGITSSKLAANAIGAANIADGSLPPTKINGTAAVLGANTFTGSQTMAGLNVNGPVNIQGGVNSIISATNIIAAQLNGNLAATNSVGGTAVTVKGGSPTGGALVANSSFRAIDAFSNFSYGVFASSGATGVHADGTTTGVEAQSANGVAVQATITNTQGTAGVPGIFANMGTGKLLSGRSGAGQAEVFNVDTAGNILASGALSAQYQNSASGTFLNQLAKLDFNGLATLPNPADTTGIIGIVTAGAGSSGSAQIAYSGIATCLFDHPTSGKGDYVGISHTRPGFCTDLGFAYPSSGQVIGRVLQFSSGLNNPAPVMLFGPEQHAFPGGSVSIISTGSGLTGGPITSSGTISIANAGVTNAMLQNNSITITPGAGLSGGGPVTLGGSVTLGNTGTLSFNGRAGAVVPASGDYSFAQLTGSVNPLQLPSTVVYSNQSNTFSGSQTINGNVTATAFNGDGSAVTNVNASKLGGLAATDLPKLNGSNIFTGANQDFNGSSAGTTPLITIEDYGTLEALHVSSPNSIAAEFSSNAPVVFQAISPANGASMVMRNNGNVDITGQVTAAAFSGDGSRLSFVNATSVSGHAASDFALSIQVTNEANLRQAQDTALQNNINAETQARASADTSLQNSLNVESQLRATADTGLQNSLNTETASRQAGETNLQTSINNVSAASAKLAASNTFTAGTQDFSGAAATLPVHAVTGAQAPALCVAGKELLIQTDAPAGQQLFICNAGGTGWNLVGDGASGGVTAFNGRNGSVSPASGDYSFSQISGSLNGSQLPSLSGDVSSAAGSTVTTLAPSGVTSGTYTRVTVDTKGRATSGSQASFSDLAGSAGASQLPAAVVYNNQANTFTGNQTVNGTVSATAFSGSGAGLANVNAASVNGLTSASFAQLAAANSFTGKQTLAAATASAASLNVPAGVSPSAPASGDVWNTGSVLQYRDNASATRSLVSTTQSGGMQLLKLTASITPTAIAVNACTEQSFTFSGINAGDVLLSVLQPSTSSPGINIAIGGFRVSAANTVAIQFCNVGKNTSSTPTAGIYTIALLR